MKNKLWLAQLPVVMLFTSAFLVTEMGSRGELSPGFVHDKVFPVLRNISTQFTDLKFRMRGPVPPKNKVVVVEVDSQALEHWGRWPWHRDMIGYLIDSIFKAGAKVVGLDAVFSEPDERVPAELKQLLQQQNLGAVVDQFETDHALRATIDQYKDRLVLGWATDTLCQPLYDAKENGCVVTSAEALATHPPEMPKFSYTTFEMPKGLDALQTPAYSLVTFIANLPMFNEPARHAGYFNIVTDGDGYVRRIPLVFLADNRPYPSLALEMARIGLDEELKVDFDARYRVKSLGFVKSGRKIPVNPLGVAEINFRGPGRTFKYVPAVNVVMTGEGMTGATPEVIAETQKAHAEAVEAIKDAYVVVGVTALGVYDMRAFPFDSNVPGVEGHASILDNILSGDFMTRGAGEHSWIWVVLLMTVGALVLAYFIQRLESVPALALFAVVFLGFSWADLKLFSLTQNWDTSFFTLEVSTIFVLIVAIKYVVEERSKKFVRGAFAKYVAPAVVDSILKDPAKLTVGGEKRDLTIMFSDIRSFTTFSEKMDAKALAAFLNEYLGSMTEIVFAHEGTLDKYIGDAIMAFWGAPLDQPLHAANACKTAIEMMKNLNARKDKFKADYGIDVNIGIGINTGAVSVGNMGSSKNFAYTVIGDHVNLASRLEGLTKAYGVSILTTRFTLDDIQQSGAPLPPHRVLDHVKVKGKKKAVELIQVLDREYSAQGLALFEEGRKLYEQQQWDEAAAKFREANSLLAIAPEVPDGPCAEYLERCKMFKESSPGVGWDGSWEMHTK